MHSTLHQFHAFAAAKPAAEPYDYTDVEHCALGQFSAVMGWTGTAMGYLDAQGEWYAYPSSARWAAYVDEGPKTFGALAERLAAEMVR